MVNAENFQVQGKHIAITGATAGIGRAAALTLARLGARLTLFNRNPERAAVLADEIIQATGVQPRMITMDMANLSDVRRAAAELLATGDDLDVLLNNAGVVNTQRVVTVDGFEETLAVNHFAPFLLTGLLLPAMRERTRIVNVSSAAHAFVRDMDFDDLHAANGYRTMREYGRSKLANLLFTLELAGRLESRHIAVNALHPGAVRTSLGRQNNGFFATLLPRVLGLFFKGAERGSQTSIYLCASQNVEGLSGGYYVDCRKVSPKPWALDHEAASRLWQISESSVDFSYDEHLTTHHRRT